MAVLLSPSIRWSGGPSYSSFGWRIIWVLLTSTGGRWWCFLPSKKETQQSYKKHVVQFNDLVERSKTFCTNSKEEGRHKHHPKGKREKEEGERRRRRGLPSSWVVPVYPSIGQCVSSLLLVSGAATLPPPFCFGLALPCPPLLYWRSAAFTTSSIGVARPASSPLWVALLLLSLLSDAACPWWCCCLPSSFGWW